MASTIRIKRSSVSGNPITLAAGELAYSALADSGSNGGDRLYIGIGAETSGNAANHFVIGGKFFTDRLDHTSGVLTANKALVADASSKLDNLKVDNLDLNGNTLSATNTNGSLVLASNGTGKININSLYNLPTADGTADQYIKTDGAGNLSFASIPSGSFTIVGNSGTDLFTTGQTLTFVGSGAITTTVTDNNVAFSIADASTSVKGVASFAAASFDVASGAVSIKSAGVSNAQLANSSVTIGTTAVSLGSSSTTLAGLTSVAVGNLNSAGNTISSTNANGDIVLDPNGSGTVSVTNARITNLATPTDATDAATKAYVDAVSQGLNVHAAVKAITLSPLATLSGGTVTYNNGSSGVGATLTLANALSTIDSYTLVDGDRIIIAGEAAQANNGIYIRTSSTVFTRASDFDTTAEISGGDFVFVQNGTTYGNTGWVETLTASTVGTSPITFVQFSGAGTYTAGNGLTLTGTTFDVVGTTNRISVSGDAIDISNSYVGQTSITTLGTITTGTWSGTAIGTTKGGTGLTAYASGDLLYASASNTLSALAASTEGKVLQVSSGGMPVWGDLDGGTY